MGVRVWVGLSGSSERIFEEMVMKKFALATAITLAASTAYAGNLEDPIVEEPPIVEETSSSAGGIFIPLLFIVLAAGAASN